MKMADAETMAENPGDMDAMTENPSDALLASVKLEITEGNTKGEGEVENPESNETLNDLHEDNSNQDMHPVIERNGSTDPIKFSSGGIDQRLTDIQSRVDDKSQLLNTAWTDLYNLLGEYKAEVFSKRMMTQKYESVSDIDQLRNEMIDKDNEIIELRNQIEQIHRHSEQSQLDLSVKDSLLKKYQEDLLAKESQLLTSNSKMARLENRIRMFENKSNVQQMTPPPRKAMRTQMSPGRGMSLTGGIMRTAQVGASRFAPAGRMLAAGLARSVPGPARRRAAVPPQLMRRPAPATMSIPPPTTAKEPIVCIEVDDDDEIKTIQDAAQSLPQADNSEDGSLYMQQWTEHSGLETDATDENTLPGATTNPEGFPMSDTLENITDPSQQGMLIDSQPQFPGQDDLLEGQQPWPVQMSPADLSQFQNQGRSQPQPNKKLCKFCGMLFNWQSNLSRHISEIHLGKKNHICEICGAKFARRGDYKLHIHRLHPTLIGSHLEKTLPH